MAYLAQQVCVFIEHKVNCTWPINLSVCTGKHPCPLCEIDKDHMQVALTTRGAYPERTLLVGILYVPDVILDLPEAIVRHWS